MITLSSSTNTFSLKTHPSPPNMPCAKKNTYTATRQGSLIAMCAFTSSPLPPLIPLPGCHKLDRFPKETSYPYHHLPSICRDGRGHRSAHRSTQQTRRTSSHPSRSHPPSHDHRYHATVAVYNRNTSCRGGFKGTRGRTDRKVRALYAAFYGHQHPDQRRMHLSLGKTLEQKNQWSVHDFRRRPSCPNLSPR